MGWLFMSRYHMGGHTTPKAYLDAQFTYDKGATDAARGLRVIDSAIVGMRTYYAAAQLIERGRPGDVIAIVCLIRWNPNNRDGEHFGYKDMDETMGPCEDECPERILRLLTPTDNEHALQWRRRCLANLRLRKRPIVEGMRIRMAEELTFTDGHKGGTGERRPEIVR